MKLCVGVALVVSLAIAGPAWAQFYKYLDKHGNVRFTDDINQVPENQRVKARSYVESEPTAPFSTSPIREPKKGCCRHRRGQGLPLPAGLQVPAMMRRWSLPKALKS
jgi:hypothetical protein